MAPIFFFTLAGGMSAVLGTGPVMETAWKFLRLSAFIILALSSVATMLVWNQGHGAAGVASPTVVALGIVAMAAAAASALIAPAGGQIPRILRAIFLAGGLSGISAGFVLARAGMATDHLVAGSVLGALNQGSAALVLGGITVAWLLGHAYLTATSMTIAPLRHFSRVLSWVIAGRAGVVVLSVAVAVIVDGGPPRGVIAGLRNDWMIAALRVGLGLVAAGVFARMVSQCVRLRATQSATGILYFGSLFVYIGELAAQHLSRELGWPL